MSEAEIKNKVSSSMIELKAELFRKKEEFASQKAATAGFVKGKKVEKGEKTSIWNQKNKGVANRAIKDKELDDKEEEQNVFEKSRKALEEKAKLYDKISTDSNISEEDGSGYFLVDFQKKSIDSIVSEKELQRQKELEEEKEEERKALLVEVPEASTPDEEWVDFVDSMGRSCRCLKKDLDHLMKQDKELAINQSNKKKGIMAGCKMQSALTGDDYREKMRQKWEAEAEELRQQEHGQVHYSNVQFDEIRTHGVGFFQFSKDHGTREEQMDSLNKLHEETVGEKSRRDKIKDKRKSMMEARLAKVRQRRGLKDTAVQIEKTENAANAASALNESKPDEKMLKKLEEEQEAEKKRKSHVRDWDKDKKFTSIEMMHQNYLEKQRQARDEEFAPPSLYFQDSKPRTGQNKPSRPVVSDQARIERLQGLTKQKSIPSCSKYVHHHPTTRVHESSQNPQVPIAGATGSNDNSFYALPHQMDSHIPPPSDIGESSCVLPNHGNFYAGYSVTGGEISSQQNAYDSQNYKAYNQQSVFSTKAPELASSQSPGNVNAFNFHHHHLGKSLSNQFHQPTAHQTSLKTSAEINEIASEQKQNTTTSEYVQWTNSMAANCNFYSPQESSQNFKNPRAHKKRRNPHQNTSENSNVKARASKRPSVTSEQTVKINKKQFVPKAAVVDMRYMQNEVESDGDIIVDIAVSTVDYTPGSFTAAKEANKDLYEQEVLDSQAKDQITGAAHMYTAEELEEQRKEEEAQEKMEDFLNSLKDHS